MGIRENLQNITVCPIESLQARHKFSSIIIELVAQVGHCVKYPKNGHRGILFIQSECNIEITEGGKSDSPFVKTFHSGDAINAWHFSQRA